MNLLKNERKLSGGALTTLMFLSICFMVWFLPINAFAAETVNWNTILETIGNGEENKSDSGWNYDSSQRRITINDGYAITGDSEITFPVTNNGTISSGTFTDEVTNKGYILAGTFNGTVTNKGIIKAGTFNGTVTNDSRIYGGTFTNTVTNKNDSYIHDGTFNGTVTNGSTISGGRFTREVTNKGTIKAGTFNGNVTNEGTIEAGTFKETVTNESLITEGVFKGNVINKAESNARITGGTFEGAVANGRDCYISSATFTNTVTNEGFITSGRFEGAVTNKNTIEGGTFTDTVTNEGTISKGTFNIIMNKIGGNVGDEPNVIYNRLINEGDTPNPNPTPNPGEGENGTQQPTPNPGEGGNDSTAPNTSVTEGPTEEEIAKWKAEELEKKIKAEEAIPVTDFISTASVKDIPAEVKENASTKVVYNVSKITFVRGFVAAVDKIAKENTDEKTMTLYSKSPFTFSETSLTAIANTNKDFVYMFKHKDQLYKITIPAGAKVDLEGQMFAGPLYIGAKLGTSAIVE